MNITISDKSPVYSKLVSLGHKLALDPSLLAAGMCHAALNAPGSTTVQYPVPVATPAAPASIPAAEQSAAPVETAAEPARKPAPSAGLFNI